MILQNFKGHTKLLKNKIKKFLNKVAIPTVIIGCLSFSLFICVSIWGLLLFAISIDENIPTPNYSSATMTPIPTITPTSTVTLTPMPTVIMLPTPTSLYELPDKTVCDCSGDSLNCSDFAKQSESQSCFDHCSQISGYDVHQLDGDNDSYTCETLP